MVSTKVSACTFVGGATRMVHRQIVLDIVLTSFVAWVFASLCAVAEHPVIDLFWRSAGVWCFEQALK